MKENEIGIISVSLLLRKARRRAKKRRRRVPDCRGRTPLRRSARSIAAGRIRRRRFARRRSREQQRRSHPARIVNDQHLTLPSTPFPPPVPSRSRPCLPQVEQPRRQIARSEITSQRRISRTTASTLAEVRKASTPSDRSSEYSIRRFLPTSIRSKATTFPATRLALRIFLLRYAIASSRRPPPSRHSCNQSSTRSSSSSSPQSPAVPSPPSSLPRSPSPRTMISEDESRTLKIAGDKFKAVSAERGAVLGG